MVYFLFEHERARDEPLERRAHLHAPRKAPLGSPRHQIEPTERVAKWKPLLHPTHQHELLRQESAARATRASPAREHPHLWREIVLHARNDLE